MSDVSSLLIDVVVLDLVFQGVRSRVRSPVLLFCYRTTTPPSGHRHAMSMIYTAMTSADLMAFNISRSLSISTICTCHVATSASCQSSAFPACANAASLASTSASNALRLLHLVVRETRERRRLFTLLLSPWNSLQGGQFFFLHFPRLSLHWGLASGLLMQGLLASPPVGLFCRRRLSRV